MMQPWLMEILESDDDGDGDHPLFDEEDDEGNT